MFVCSIYPGPCCTNIERPETLQLNRWSVPNVNATLCSSWSAPLITKWLPTELILLFFRWLFHYLPKISEIWSKHSRRLRFDPSTIITSNCDVRYAQTLFYIHLENVNRRHGDVTASRGSTFETNPKKLGAIQRERNVDPWIASEVTTLWRYTNLFIIIIIILFFYFFNLGRSSLLLLLFTGRFVNHPFVQQTPEFCGSKFLQHRNKTRAGTHLLGPAFDSGSLYFCRCTTSLNGCWGKLLSR